MMLSTSLGSSTVSAAAIKLGGTRSSREPHGGEPDAIALHVDVDQVGVRDCGAATAAGEAFGEAGALVYAETQRRLDPVKLAGLRTVTSAGRSAVSMNSRASEERKFARMALLEELVKFILIRLGVAAIARRC